ncbi:MAG TPA: glycosyltransferase family 39 protein [Chloroflexia bacterium]
MSAQSPISILEAEAQKPDVQVAPAPATMPTEHRGARPWLPWAGVAALTLLAFLLRRYRLGSESFWFDEADIVQRAMQPVSTLLQGFTEAGENGPLYTLMLHYWLAAIETFPPLDSALHLIFGTGMEAPVRGLSVMFGTAAIPVMYALARRVGGTALGFTAAVLLAINPFHIWHSQDAKMYTLLVLTALASTLLYVEALQRNKVVLWAAYVLATWVMLTVHSMSGLVLLAQLAATPFLFRTQIPNPKSRWVLWGWAMLLILGPLFPIAWLRLAALLNNTLDVGNWYQTTGLTDILSTIFVTFAVNRSAPEWELTGAIVMAFLAALGVWALLRPTATRATPAHSELGTRNSELKTPYAPLIIALWLVPIFVFWLVTLRVPLFHPRYLIMALPPYLLMAGVGLLWLRRIHVAAPAIAAGVLGLASVMALLGVNYSQEVQKEDWRGAMVYVQDHLRLRDAIIVFPGYLVTAVDTYYKPGGPGQVPEVPVIASIPSMRTEGFGQRELEMALREAIKGHERVWLITSPVRQESEDPDNRVQQWLQYNWNTFDTKVFNGVTVYGISFHEVREIWFPGPDYPERHTYPNGLTFEGYIYEIRADATQQRDASYFSLTLYWLTTQRLQQDYIFRVRIKDPTGKVIVDDSAGPLNGYWRTSEWPPGKHIIDYRDLRLPGGLTPGNYTVTLEVHPPGQPGLPLKTEEGITEIVFRAPLQVIPWTE